MKKYEYKTVRLDSGCTDENQLDNTLNDMGSKGWKFVEMHPYSNPSWTIFIFERELK